VRDSRVVASAIVPKMLAVRSQREEKAIIAVADLLRMYAFRNAAGRSRLGCTTTHLFARYRLWIYDLNPESPEGPRIWQPDPIEQRR
jgi:hypothetical protein